MKEVVAGVTAVMWHGNCCEHGDELWAPINGREFVHQLKYCTAFEVLAAVLLKIQLCWDVTPCRLASGLHELLDSECEGNTIFRNVGKCSPATQYHFFISARVARRHGPCV